MSTAKSVNKAASVPKTARDHSGWNRYVASLKYGLYVITHPFDGFWDLVHEKKGTLAAAHTFLILFLLIRVMKLMLTSFQFISAPVQYINVFEEMGSLALPFILIQLPMILVSHMLTFEEGSFYSVLLSVSVVWSVFLVFTGLMEVHDYGPGKTFIFLIVTIVGAAVIIFLLLTFFSLLGDAAGFFITLYREIVFRLN